MICLYRGDDSPSSAEIRFSLVSGAELSQDYSLAIVGSGYSFVSRDELFSPLTHWTCHIFKASFWMILHEFFYYLQIPSKVSRWIVLLSWNTLNFATLISIFLYSVSLFVGSIELTFICRTNCVASTQMFCFVGRDSWSTLLACTKLILWI